MARSLDAGLSWDGSMQAYVRGGGGLFQPEKQPKAREVTGKHEKAEWGNRAQGYRQVMSDDSETHSPDIMTGGDPTAGCFQVVMATYV